VVVLPGLIEGYLRDLQRVVGKEPDRARVIVQKLIGEVTMEPNNKGLEAVLRGNLASVLNLEEKYCTTGAGRGILFERRARVRIA